MQRIGRVLPRLICFPVLLVLTACVGIRTGPPELSGPPAEHSERAAPQPAPGEAFPDATPVEGGAQSLLLTVPPSWRPIPPSSSMRRAQWVVPGIPPAGEAEATLFFFGSGQGGSLTANLERWKGQFQKADGAPAGPDARVARRTVNGIPVTILDISGTYSGGAMAGGDEGGPKSGYRMIAAVFDLPGGPWFLRLLGPADSVGAAAGGFDSVVATAHPGESAR